MSANSRIRFALQIILICLYSAPSHYHHCANLSEDIKTYKMPVRYILLSVWVFSQWSIIQSIIQYVGLCVFSLPTPLVMIERIYILCLIIIIKSEVYITHCLGLGHETMVCAVCLSIFFSFSTCIFLYHKPNKTPSTIPLCNLPIHHFFHRLQKTHPYCRPFVLDKQTVCTHIDVRQCRFIVMLSNTIRYENNQSIGIWTGIAAV